MRRTIGRIGATAIILSLGVSLPAARASADDAVAGAARATQESPLTEHGRRMFSGITTILLRAAASMPEERYGFRPVDSVRTFGEIVGHVAETQYMFCSAVRGEASPAPDVDKSKRSKAELTAALEGALAYCDAAYDGMTDRRGAEMVKAMGRDMPKLGVLQVNQLHAIEHYGNLVTYLRMNGIVPPTSDPEVMKQMAR